MSSAAVDYYALLGVQADASDEQLRSAWRRLAARWHPDRAGADATVTFQQLSAAYEVLSNPVARAAYDRRRRVQSPESFPAQPTSSSRPSAPATMLSRLCGNLNSLLARGAARYDDGEPPGVITLVLRESEAAQGGMATIALRVDLRCPDCAAPTSPLPAGCTRCGGNRLVEELFSAWIAVPPGIAEGELLAPSVELPGMVEPVKFRVRRAVKRSDEAPSLH